MKFLSLFQILELGLKSGSFPVAEKAGQRVMSLPNYPEMTQEMLDIVVEKVKTVLSPGT